MTLPSPNVPDKAKLAIQSQGRKVTRTCVRKDVVTPLNNSEVIRLYEQRVEILIPPVTLISCSFQVLYNIKRLFLNERITSFFSFLIHKNINYKETSLLLSE